MNFKQSLSNSNWFRVMQIGFDALVRKNMWTFIYLPSGWVVNGFSKNKYNVDSSFQRHMTHYQIPNIDYT